MDDRFNIFLNGPFKKKKVSKCFAPIVTKKQVFSLSVVEEMQKLSKYNKK